jgi:hypothetical protein
LLWQEKSNPRIKLRGSKRFFMENELEVIEIKERKLFFNLRNEKRFESTISNPLKNKKAQVSQLGLPTNLLKN